MNQPLSQFVLRMQAGDTVRRSKVYYPFCNIDTVWLAVAKQVVHVLRHPLLVCELPI